MLGGQVGFSMWSGHSEAKMLSNKHEHEVRNLTNVKKKKKFQNYKALELFFSAVFTQVFDLSLLPII